MSVGRVLNPEQIANTLPLPSVIRDRDKRLARAVTCTRNEAWGARRTRRDHRLRYQRVVERFFGQMLHWLMFAGLLAFASNEIRNRVRSPSRDRHGRAWWRSLLLQSAGSSATQSELAPATKDVPSVVAALNGQFDAPTSDGSRVLWWHGRAREQAELREPK